MIQSISDFDYLRSRLRGSMLRAEDAGFDSARALWNGMIDKRPAAIVRCAGTADVMQSVAFAREAGLPLAIRGGGHNVAGNAMCDGGIVIDLSSMRSVHVDVLHRTARVEGGCTWRDFDHEASAFGLATTGGVIPSTGVAGLTLGGGFGWLMGKHGLSCDNLLSVDVVTAEGQLITASRNSHADLFWGLRGGGGNFGVATSFEFQLHPVDRVLGGMIVHPLKDARRVLDFWREYIGSAPDELGTQAGFLTTPDGIRVVAIIVCYAGPISAGHSAVAPLRAFGHPLADTVAEMPYTQLQALIESGFPPGMRNYWKSSFLATLGDGASEAITAAFERVPSTTSAIAIEDVRGAVHRIGADETAFGHRGHHINLLICGIWRNRTDDAAHVRWVRELWNAIQPFSTGDVYVNYLGAEIDEGSDRVKAAYGADKYARLVALKRKYDPENLFRLNQNIKP